MHTKKTDRTYSLADKEGEAYWFVGALLQRKAGGADTDGRFALLDQTMPPDYAVPRHIHINEDEAWYLLEGAMTFYCGERVIEASKYSWVFAPRGIPHTFKVGSEGARALTFAFPSSFADFVAEMGEPAPQLTVPPPAPVDPHHLAEVAHRYGIEIVGPPPSK
jgi:mannose-6-phosphate isomerase-like protein (cupin superfamily)